MLYVTIKNKETVNLGAVWICLSRLARVIDNFFLEKNLNGVHFGATQGAPRGGHGLSSPLPI